MITSSLPKYPRAFQKLCMFLLALLVCSANAQVQSSEGLKPINGTKLYVKVFGKGEPLLIVHGGPGLNHTYFLPHLQSLAKDFTVILYDQRACGRSAIPSPDSVGLNFFIQDIESIRKDLGYNKINILGHSWGAIPVVRYGIDYPDKVSTMILCNAIALNHEFDVEISAIQKKQMTSADSVKRADIINSPEYKSGKIEAYQKLIRFSFRNSFHDQANLAKLNLELPDNYNQARAVLRSGLGKDLVQYDFYDAIRQFKFPVLILHGQFDFLPLRASQKIQANVPQGKLVVFEKSGHFIFIEEPEKFRKVLVTFIKK